MAGSTRRMFCGLSAMLLALISALCVPAVLAGEEQGSTLGKEGASTEVRFELPEGSDRRVHLGTGKGEITLELPNGTKFPTDMTGIGSGLVVGQDVVPLDGNRVRVALTVLEDIDISADYTAGTFVLRLIRDTGPDSISGLSFAQYKLGADDKIMVSVGGHPDLTQHLVVRRNGKINAPLVGEIDAAGLTVQELGHRLEGLLAAEYLVDPQVNVQVLEYNSQWVLVTGEVRNAGRIPLRGVTDLKEVLAEAGGCTGEAGRNIMISREHGGPGIDGNIKIDRRDFENGQVNPLLKQGDIVNVTKVAYSFIQGEVRSSGRVRIDPGMTLLKAISLVGGLTEWADKKDVRILEEGWGNPSKVYNLKRIQKRYDPDPILTGGEIIIVGRRFL